MEAVPTMEELTRRGLARVVAWTGGKTPTPTHYQATPEGQQLIYDAMARNAAEGKTDHAR